MGTIAPGVDDFIIDITSREDVEIHDVTQNNRKLLREFILNKIPALLMHYRKKFPSPDKNGKILPINIM